MDSLIKKNLIATFNLSLKLGWQLIESYMVEIHLTENFLPNSVRSCFFDLPKNYQLKIVCFNLHFLLNALVLIMLDKFEGEL